MKLSAQLTILFAVLLVATLFVSPFVLFFALIVGTLKAIFTHDKRS